MINLEGISSLIESIYLKESVGNRQGICNIFVNPESVSYLAGKTIIINMPDYPEEKLEILKNNGCKIISRIYTNIGYIEVQPYILRVDFDILWNGRTLGDDTETDEILSEGDSCFDEDNGILYFPKIVYKDKSKLMDSWGNLNCIGWALQQVGINVKTDTPFINLDIIKTKKVVF